MVDEWALPKAGVWSFHEHKLVLNLRENVKESSIQIFENLAKHEKLFVTLNDRLPDGEIYIGFNYLDNVPEEIISEMRLFADMDEIPWKNIKHV